MPIIPTDDRDLTGHLLFVGLSFDFSHLIKLFLCSILSQFFILTLCHWRHELKRRLYGHRGCGQVSMKLVAESRPLRSWRPPMTPLKGKKIIPTIKVGTGESHDSNS